jgi:hypothetical protein
MRPCIEIDKFFIIGGKKSIFILNLLRHIPEKCMGRHVEMDIINSHITININVGSGRVLPSDSDRLSKFPLPGIKAMVPDT